MPNETCFLVAYVLAFILEVARFGSSGEWTRRWAWRIASGMMVLAFLTHTLYLAYRVWGSWSPNQFAAFRTWHDWGFLAAWLIAGASLWMSYRRSDKQTGLFVLPIIIGIVGLAIAFPSPSPIGTSSSASFWRLTHSAAMLIGTMLVALGFAVAMMYFVQGWRLKHPGSSANALRLPSLEYLQSIGRKCILGSAVAVGFGVVSGGIMNVMQHGQIAWTDRGILFSTALFVWLSIAAVLQWILSKRGRGEWTAILSVLSFAIVLVAFAVVMSAPHGSSPTSLAAPLVGRWRA
ncbi:MAG: hypothetical protein ACK6DC_05430 [Planctomycetota bacterium]|jgi:hypothetical protein